MALTKVNRGGLNTGVSDSSNATFLTVDSSEQAVIKSEGGAVTTSVQQGLAKSWTYIHGTDTFAIINSFNTASATDNGSGDYTTVRTNAFSNDDFATAGICSATAGSDPHYNFVVENVDNKLRTTTSLRTYILNARGDQSTNDAPDFSITFMGDLA